MAILLRFLPFRCCEVAQPMPLSRMALLCDICLLEKRPFFTNITLIESNRMDKATTSIVYNKILAIAVIR